MYLDAEFIINNLNKAIEIMEIKDQGLNLEKLGIQQVKVWQHLYNISFLALNIYTYLCNLIYRCMYCMYPAIMREIIEHIYIPTLDFRIMLPSFEIF